jgi:D-proline reductase (dithiol) PrdB
MKDSYDDRPAVLRKSSAPVGDSEAKLSLPALIQALETLDDHYSWRNHFRAEHPGFDFPSFDDIPWTEFKRGLADCKLAVITSAGVFVKGQKPFSIASSVLPERLLEQKFKGPGDWSYRVISADVDTQELRIAHSQLDSKRVELDVNCVFPIDRVRELVEESYIAETAANHFALMGHVPDFKRLYEKTVPEILQRLEQDQVTAVLITPGDCLSHQTDAVLQREIEKGGIATVSVSLCQDVTEHVGVPRAVAVRFPFGHTFGAIADDIMQMRIFKDALQVLETASSPGEVVPLPYRWVDE